MAWTGGLEGFSGAVQVKGTCLVPRVSPGSWAWYDAARVPLPGDLVVVLDGDETVVKELHEWEGERWLAPLRGRMPYRLAPPMRLLGTVALVMHPP